jgi:hypothetical protein
MTRTSLFRFATLLTGIALLGACSSDDGNTPDIDAGDTSDDGSGDVGTDADTTETDAEADAETGTDAETDVEADADTTDTGTASGLPCTEQDECPDGEFCVENVCSYVTCRGDEFSWDFCESALNAIEPDLGRFATCTDSRCRIGCQLDSDCDEGDFCTDFGYCREWTGNITDVHPGSGGENAPLRAGISNVVWNFPIGLPLGGYGERAAVNDGRYAVSLTASTGLMHGFYIRALALDTGDRKFLIIRIPTIFTGFALHEGVSRLLQERYGDDWRSSLIISSTHTHSGPCRHWHLPEIAAASLGSFGIGEYSEWAYEWILESTFDAAVEAIEALEPARIGWEIVEAYDNDDSVGRDRWNQTPHFDDNRLLLMRVDNAEGDPMGVLFSYGAHGTENGSNYATGDALGGTEHWLEYELGRRYGRLVPTMYLNQNSGSMSPAGDRGGHRFPQTFERIGWAFTEKVIDRIVDMETSSNLEIDGYTHRFTMTYDNLGYARGEFAGSGPRPIGGEYHYGGISCGSSVSGDQDFSTFASLSDLVCVGAIQFLLLNQAPTEFAKTQVLVGQFRQEGRESLSFSTAPGELAMELAWDIAKQLRDDHGIDPLNFWTFGYANSHLLYILPTNVRGERPPYPGLTLPHPSNTAFDENGFPVMPGAPDDYPDFALSYLQGGYEASMSPWGPGLGDFMKHEISNAWTRLFDPDAEIDTITTLPIAMSPRDDAPFPIDTTSADVIGDIILDVPSEVARLDWVEFAWVGGDPGAEMPQVPVVTLELLEGDTWTVVTLPNTLPYSNYEPRFMTRVRKVGENYEWVVRWEELKDFPLGRYRYAVSGHYWNGTERVPYSLTSAEFDLTPVEFTLPVVGEAAVTLTSEALVAYLGYPASERMEFLDIRRDRGAVEGNFRMRHPWVPLDVPDPMIAGADIGNDSVDVTITGPGGTVDLLGASIELVTNDAPIVGRAVPRTSYTLEFMDALAAGTYTVSITVTDIHGNIGSFTGDFEVAASAD